MANRLPQQVREKIICIVYRKADEFAYMECDRVKKWPIYGHTGGRP